MGLGNTCRECGGSGVIILDGDRMKCANCDPTGSRTDGGHASQRAPGADVLLQRDKARALGVPMVALSGVPIRAVVIADDLVVQLAAVATVLLSKPTPEETEAARAVIRSLPPHFAVELEPTRYAAACTGVAEPAQRVVAAPLTPTG